jgi:tRNA(Ile2) C34 agmatinyltransferase TiaS
MEDDIITEDEESELETLRKKLNLDKAVTEQLLQIYARQKLASRCPHCGKPIASRVGGHS